MHIWRNEIIIIKIISYENVLYVLYKYWKNKELNHINIMCIYKIFVIIKCLKMAFRSYRIGQNIFITCKIK